MLDEVEDCEECEDAVEDALLDKAEDAPLDKTLEEIKELLDELEELDPQQPQPDINLTGIILLLNCHKAYSRDNYPQGHRDIGSSPEAAHSRRQHR